MLSCGGAKGSQEPRYVVSPLDAAEEACRLDAKRWRIETVVSEQKSRGCPRHTSPLAEPQRLSRLLIAAWCAAMWIVSLGAVCEQEGEVRMIHRGERGDGRVFQFGLRLLDHFLHEGFAIPVAFHTVM